MKSVKQLSKYTSILLSMLLMFSIMSPGITALAQEKENAAPTALTYEDDSITAELKAVDGADLPVGAVLIVKGLNKDSQDETERALYAETEAGLNAKAAEQGAAVDGFAAYSVSLKDKKGTDITPETGAFILKLTYKAATAPDAWLTSTSTQKTVQLYQKTEGKDEQNNAVATMEPQQAEKTQITPDADNKVQAVESELTTLQPMAVAWQSVPEAEPQAAGEGEEQPAVEETEGTVVEGGNTEEQPAEEGVTPIDSEVFTDAGPVIMATPNTYQNSEKNLLRSRSAVMPAAETETKSNEGIKLSKTAQYNRDGTYTINLESYVTGDVTTESIPTDIVMVLDQSGSMGTKLASNVEVFDNGALDTQKAQNAQNRQYYIIINISGYGPTKYYLQYDKTNGWYYTFGGNKKVIPKTAVDDPNPTHVQFYKESYTRLDALKDAANNFVNSISTDPRMHGINNRIAVVGYADKNSKNNELFIGSVGYPYDGSAIEGQYSQALQDVTTEAGYENVKASLKALSPDGATNAHIGIEMANNVLEKNPLSAGEKRNRVVIMFTDGEPNDHSGFVRSIANQAIQNAYKTKNTYGATFYTVGLVEGLQPSKDLTNVPTYIGPDNGTERETGDPSNKMNQYMHYVSSNYPNATELTYQENNQASSVVKTAGDHYNYQAGYYLSANDAESLNKIFDNIFQQIAKPKVEVDGTTSVMDYVSDYFDIVQGNDDFNIYTSEYQGENQWGERTKAGNGVKGTINYNEKTVNVSGFDYAKNFVAEKSGDQPARGQKLIIEFKVKPIEGFIGGNDVPTNLSETSFINENANIKQPFPEPAVNVQLNYDYDKNDQTIFMGDSWKDVMNFFDNKRIDGIQYKQETIQGTKEYTIDGKNNAFVNINYEVKDSQGKFVGIYTILAGMTEGTWGNGQPAINTTELSKDEKYTVTVTVAPKTPDPFNPNTNNRPGEIVKDLNLVKNPVIHVVKGQLKLVKDVSGGDNNDGQYTNISQINANQTFVFKIERYEVVYTDQPNGTRTETKGELAETFYETINFNANETDEDGRKIQWKEKCISGLKKGYYTVTEETSWVPKYTPEQAESNKGFEDAESEYKYKVEDLFIGQYIKEEQGKPVFYGLQHDKENAEQNNPYQEYAIGDYARVNIKNGVKSRNEWKWLSDAAAAVNVFNKN